MSKKPMLFFSFILIACFSHAQKLRWFKNTYKPANTDIISKKIKADNNGNIFILTYDDSVLKGIRLFKCSSASGDTLWSRKYQYLQPADMELDSLGKIYIAATTVDKATQDFLTFKVDQTGKTEWSQTWNDSLNLGDYAVDLSLDKKGNVYVTGYSEYNTNDIAYNTNISTIKYSNAGQLQLRRTYGGVLGRTDKPLCMNVDSKGNIYVGGFVFPNSGSTSNFDSDLILLKYDSLGNQKWKYQSNNSSHNDAIEKIQVDNQGNVLIAGIGEGNYGLNPIVIKLSSDGNLMWKVSNETVTDETGIVGLEQDVFGDIVLVDNSSTILKISQQGSIIWKSSGAINYPADMVLDTLGNIFLAGNTGNEGSAFSNAYTVKINKVGFIEWRNDFKDNTNNEKRCVQSITKDDRGYIYISGNKDISATGYLIYYSLCPGDNYCLNPATQFSVTNKPNLILSKDFDKDHYPDNLLINTNTGVSTILLNNKNGGFNSNTSLTLNKNLVNPHLTDVNGDQIPDLIVGNKDLKSFSIYIGNGIGGFVYQAERVLDITPASLVCSDLNLDGYTDIILSGSPNLLNIYYGDANNGYSNSLSISMLDYFGSIAIADLNNDSYPDIIGTNSVNLFVYLINNKDATFQDPVSFGSNLFGQKKIIVKDINNNQIPDLVVAYSKTIYNVINDGHPNFSYGESVPLISGLTDFNVVDFNNDEDWDVIAVDSNLYYTLYMMLPDPCDNKYNKNTTSILTNKLAFAVNDYDLDSKNDLLTINYDVYNTMTNNVSLYTNCIWFDNKVTTNIENETSGLYYNYHSNKFNITYANPFSEYTTLNFSEPVQEGSLMVYDNLGRLVLQTDNVTGQIYVLKRGLLKSGIYYFRLSSKGQNLFSGNVLIVD